MLTVKNSRALLALAAAAMLAVTACASNDDEETAGAPAGSNKATDTPIVLGYYNQMKSPYQNFPAYTAGTEAAVEYINNELGGVDGHPIQLEKCETAGTPESTQDCAQKIAAKNPVAIVNGVDFNHSAANKVFAAAGIPMIGSIPLQPADYGMENTYFFFGGTAADLASRAIFVNEVLGAKNVGIIYDSPIGGEISFLTDYLDDADIGYDIVDASGANDYTGPFSALDADEQDAIITILGTPQGCIGFAQARKAQMNSTPVLAISTCRAPDVVEAVGADQDGWYYTIGFEDVTDDPSDDMKALVDAVDRYTDTEPSGPVVPAFEFMMTIYDVLNAVGPDATAESVTDYMQTGSGTVFAGSDWKCGVLDEFPSVCSTEVRYYQVDGDKSVPANDGQYLDVAPILGG